MADTGTQTMSEKLRQAEHNKNPNRRRRLPANYRRNGQLDSQRVLKSLESQTEKITTVQMEGLALLKIIRHCDAAVVESVFGTLCGLARGSTLEITDSYRVRDDIQEETKYQTEMLQTLGALGVDNYNVGWYRCAFYNEFFDKDIARVQFQSQDQIPFSVLLIYDPIATRHGRLAIQAFRLKDTIMEQFKENPICSIENMQGKKISTHDIFEEVPIVLHNHQLAHGFLFELRQSRAININCASLAMHNEDDVVDMMSRLGDSIDRYRREQAEYKTYIREMRSWKHRRDDYIKEQKSHHSRFRKVSEKQLEEDFAVKTPRPQQKDSLDSILSTTLMGSLSNEMLEVVNNDFFRIWVTKGM